MTASISTLLLGMALVAAAGDDRGSGGWSEGGVLKMTLELVALPDNDLQKARIKLTVTNTSTSAIVLDRELAAGFGLRFKTDLSEGFIHSDDKDVSTKEGEQLSKPAPDAVRARFVPLKPGESLSRIHDLARPGRGAVEGHASDMNGVHHGFYREAMLGYQVPARARQLEVDAWYERGVWMMATAQFEEWFGQSAEKTGLWSGRARSNTLVITKKQGSEAAVAELNRQIEQFNAGRPGDMGISAIDQRVVRIEWAADGQLATCVDARGASFLVLTRQPDGSFKGSMKTEYHELPKPDGHSWGELVAEFTLSREMLPQDGAGLDDDVGR